MTQLQGLSFSPAEIIQQLMVNLGLGMQPTNINTDIWPISINLQASNPDNCITVYDTIGDLQGRTDDGETQEAYGFQVRLRSLDSQTGNAKARSIATAFDRLVQYAPVSIQATVGTGISQFIVYAISRNSSVLSLGKEPQTNRHLFTFNSLVTIQQTQ